MFIIWQEMRQISAKPSQSVIVINMLYPLSTGSSPIKSMLMLSKWLYGTKRGYRGPTGLEVLLLFYIQSI